MSFRDDLGNLCFYEIYLQMNSIAIPVVSEFVALKNAQRAYGQYGIGLKFRSGQSLLLSAKQQLDLSEIDGSCEWTTLSTDQAELHNLHASYRSYPNDIQVYFVNTIRKPDNSVLNGCAGHLPGRPAVNIASSGTPWTFAHELGHVLLGAAFRPVHAPTDKTNLMYAPTADITADPPTLTADQIAAIKASKYCMIPVADIPPALWYSPVPRGRR